MASWQARLYSFLLRTYLKRRPIGDEAAFVKFARRKFDPPQFLRQPVPPYAQIQAVSEDTVLGEWVTAKDAAPQHTIYYLHGGGYILGSPALYRPFTATLAKAAQARVFALNYRLAPEHRFPAAVDDAVAGYHWLLALLCHKKLVFPKKYSHAGIEFLAKRAPGYTIRHHDGRLNLHRRNGSWVMPFRS